MSDVKRIDLNEFREEGYLQELNRQFLHPLGLALEIVMMVDGSVKLGGVWDYRDDPEGMLYGEELVKSERFQNKIQNIKKIQEEKFNKRKELLGYIIQS